MFIRYHRRKHQSSSYLKWVVDRLNSLKEHITFLNCFIFKPSLIIILSLVCNNEQSIAKTSFSKVGLITRFPFLSMDGGIIIIQGSIGDFPEKLNFILDTGCGGISLDSSTVEDFKLASTISPKTINGIAQSKCARFVYNQTLHLPNLSIDQLEYHVNDYSFLTENYGLKINGVIGYSFLRRFTVKVDYDKRMIEVWKPELFKYPKRGCLLPLTIGNLAMVDAEVKDKTLLQSKYIFDTGADVSLILSDRFVKANNVLDDHRKTIEVYGAGPGGMRTMQYTALHQIRLGRYVFDNVPSLIFKDEYNVTSYPNCAGILGGELIRRFNLIVDYCNGQIFLNPNSHFKDPFDYSYSGFRIAIVKDQVVIESVVDNSPAYKAGLEPGDIVYRANNVFSDDAVDLKRVIASAQNILKMIIIRNNQIKFIVIKIEKIL